MDKAKITIPETLEELEWVAGRINRQFAERALSGKPYCVTCGVSTHGKAITQDFIQKKLQERSENKAMGPDTSGVKDTI